MYNLSSNRGSFVIKRQMNKVRWMHATPYSIRMNHAEKRSFGLMKLYLIHCCSFRLPRFWRGFQLAPTLPVNPRYVKRRPVIEGTAAINLSESVDLRSFFLNACSSTYLNIFPGPTFLHV